MILVLVIHNSSVYIATFALCKQNYKGKVRSLMHQIDTPQLANVERHILLVVLLLHYSGLQSISKHYSIVASQYYPMCSAKGVF